MRSTRSSTRAPTTRPAPPSRTSSRACATSSNGSATSPAASSPASRSRAARLTTRPAGWVRRVRRPRCWSARRRVRWSFASCGRSPGSASTARDTGRRRRSWRRPPSPSASSAVPTPTASSTSPHPSPPCRPRTAMLAPPPALVRYTADPCSLTPSPAASSSP